jgi:hypothetical protein
MRVALETLPRGIIGKESAVGSHRFKKPCQAQADVSLSYRRHR